MRLYTWLIVAGLGVNVLVQALAEPPDAGIKDMEAERQKMVGVIRERYGFSHERILSAMQKVRRHRFVPQEHVEGTDPYGDHPCPIGKGQTISQPFIVAYMTSLLDVTQEVKVLEIGTGSGYQAAVLAELGAQVYTIEIVPELAEHARKALRGEGYTNSVHVLTGDGYKGWPEHAPFDAVIVTCAPDSVPQALVDQLKDGGRMVVPVGEWSQRLVVLKKSGGRVTQADDIAVRFVPMVRGK